MPKNSSNKYLPSEDEVTECGLKQEMYTHRGRVHCLANMACREIHDSTT